ncbi:hypothetical protein [Methylobacterium sp. NEAU K]|uniref:hypothetical protein n=1 Tax=Methylobacterium sp. NEAU K TaxID=3064946 RepID=UPI0027344D5F|nr:hypothetical protein [Methylobacterium sp. NEAU K]MDP4003529.1 hypothetical protein [Methylobacterium sp. NEAU K]
MASIEVLSATLRSIAAPGMTPKALRAAAHKQHPEASRKDIVHAAFYALTEVGSQDGNGVAELHGFALAERVSEDEPPIAVGGPRKKKRRRVKSVEGVRSVERAKSATAEAVN